MFRTALIATIGFFVVCSISHADPRVDAFVQGFNKGKQGGVKGGQKRPSPAVSADNEYATSPRPVEP
jgi:hypothetical protein